MTTTVKIFPFAEIESMARALCKAQGGNPDLDIFQPSILERVYTPQGEKVVAYGPTAKLWVTYIVLAEAALKHYHDATNQA